MTVGDNFKNIRVYWLAFVVYWGIFLFGYDAGIAGGMVSQPYFQIHFGLVNPSGTVDEAKYTQVSSNVVSVLQAGQCTNFCLAWTSVDAHRIHNRVFSRGPGGSRGIGYIYGGRAVSGVGIGGISAVAPACVSECSPKGVRGRITGLAQIMVAIGVIVSYFVNLGVGLHLANSDMVWKVPFGLQLVPAGLMCWGLLMVKESPRWLASKGHVQEAIGNLAYLRKEQPDSRAVRHEIAEIEAAIREEQEAREGFGLKKSFFGDGNFIRFIIAFAIFVLQQWGGQNSVSYYAPQIFTSIGFTGTTNSLLASGIYGVVKVLATMIFIFFFVDSLGRKISLFISAAGMGITFFTVGAILRTNPVDNIQAGQ